MKSPALRPGINRQLGFTLVEIMVALLVSLILLAGVVQIFVSSKTTYNIQDGLSRLQENARYAISTLTRDVRMTGYAGCGNLRDIDPVNMVKDPPATVGLDLSTTITGLDNVADGNAYGAAPGTDVLLIRGVSPTGSTIDGTYDPKDGEVNVNGNRGWVQDDIMLVSDCVHAHIFKVTNKPDNSLGVVTLEHSDTSNNLPDYKMKPPYGPNTRVMQFQSLAYFVADTGRVNISGDPIFSLYRSGASGTEELVEGVEDMQLKYGVDTNHDFAADQYVSASDVTAAERRDIVSVQVALLMDTVENVNPTPQAYSFEGTAVSDPGDRKLRRTFSATISLRARTQ